MSEYNIIYPKTFTSSSENSLLYKNWNTSIDHVIAREIDGYSTELLELQWLIIQDDRVMIIPIFYNSNNDNYFCPVPFNSTNVEYYFNLGIKIFFYIESNQHEYQFYTSELKELTYNDSSKLIISDEAGIITVDSTGNISIQKIEVIK